jgi:NAD+ synthetase
MRIALAQINPIVGDIDGNAERIIAGVARAADSGAEMAVFPELAVTGYPPRDLVLRRDFIERNVAAVKRIADRCTHVAAVFGFVRPDPTGHGRGLLNSAAICRNGRVEATYSKMLLPTYDVFDEWRYFNPGDEPLVLGFAASSGDRRVGVTICEDLWNNRQFEGRRVYGVDPVVRTVRSGAELLINLSASPFREGIHLDREALFAAQMKENRLPLVYVNQVGGNDHLIFDGASMVLDETGRVIARAKAFEEDFLVVNLDARATNRIEPYPPGIAHVHAALVLGIRDYVKKCGFTDAVIGLSGGIDSAVTAALAVEAIGSEHVHGVSMPSRFSSPHSIEDAETLSRNLGVPLRRIPIEDAHAAYERTLRPAFEGRRPDVTEENLQARVRGTILMSLSNKFGWLLLTTGNKSELAVGYCTLYGDMCGGLAVLSDVPKTMVYALAEDINRQSGRELIPRRTIEKAPSAELRPDQMDQDVLPPYEVLDPILEEYIEHDRSPDEIVAMGFDRAVVHRVVLMVRCSEYKRKQAPVGLKVTSKAFGTGRRLPIAARY